MRTAPELESAPGFRDRGNIVFTVVLLLGLGLAWYLRDLILLVYASILFAILISPLVDWLAGRRLGRGVAMAAVLGAGVILLGLLLLLLLPPLIAEGNALLGVWPQFADATLHRLQEVPGFGRLNFSHLESHLSQAGSLALVAARGFASGVADFFTILLLTVYLVIDGESTAAWGLGFFPPAPRQRLGLALERGQRRMRRWLLGQATLALTLGVSGVIVFAALRVPYFYVLALITALLNFVPILGPIVAAVLVSVVAAGDSWSKLAGVLIFFAVYQIIDNGYLTPRVMRDAVDVPGLAVIIALAVGGSLGGILGAVLAVPTAALIAELLGEYAYHA